MAALALDVCKDHLGCVTSHEKKKPSWLLPACVVLQSYFAIETLYAVALFYNQFCGILLAECPGMAHVNHMMEHCAAASICMAHQVAALGPVTYLMNGKPIAFQEHDIDLNYLL